MARGPIGVLLGVAVASCVFAGAVAAQTGGLDPVIGTWMINVERSVWSPGPRWSPDWVNVREYAVLQDGWMRFTQSNHEHESNPNLAIGVFKIDGQRHPVHNMNTLSASMTTGRPSNLTRAYRRIDARTTESITYTDGVAGIPIVRSISDDGLTMIETTRGTNAQGVAINNVLVWDRVR